MSKMSNFGAIPTDLICRFSELTKTEIIVLSYLYASRNRKTGQCNPTVSKIARSVKINKSHVSPALKTLDGKGWIFGEPSGNILLLAEPEKVTESVTKTGQKELPNPSPSVTEPVTKVTKSVTKSYQNGNRIYKDLNKEGTKKEQRIEQSERPSRMIQLYQEAFPKNSLSIPQIEMIDREVTDERRWIEALRFWSGNDYRAQSIFKLIQYYHELKTKNGTYADKKRDKQNHESTDDYLKRIGANPG